MKQNMHKNQLGHKILKQEFQDKTEKNKAERKAFREMMLQREKEQKNA